jgi:hypothetical protein
LLQPVEKAIFDKAGILIKDIEKGKKTAKDIQSFYDWVDRYLAENYKSLFNFDLFQN